ncbi:uncharacterized protein METZ01_LOCUS359242, partial [marine metagenome]
AHPGIFPHNPDAENWTIRDWLKFDWRAGWGEEEFEETTEAFSDAFQAIDEVAETTGAKSVYIGFDNFDEALEILSKRLPFADRMKVPLKEAGEALELISEALEAEDSEQMKEEFEEPLESLKEAIDELENKQIASNALAALKSATNSFKGTWSTDGADDLHEHLKDMLKELSEENNENDRKDVFKKIIQIRDNFRKLAAGGIAFYATIESLKTVLNVNFPEAWSDPDDREEAREVLDANLKELEYKREMRKQVMNNGGKIDGPFFNDEPKLGQSLSLKYVVTNTNRGHNLPSGSLGAQPEIWMNVALVDPDGK